MLNAPSASQKSRERRAAFLLSASVDAVAVAYDNDSPTPDLAIEDDALASAERLADDLRDGNLEPEEVTARALHIAYRVVAERAQADYVDVNHVANREMDQIDDDDDDDDDDTEQQRCEAAVIERIAGLSEDTRRSMDECSGRSADLLVPTSKIATLAGHSNRVTCCVVFVEEVGRSVGVRIPRSRCGIWTLTP